MQVSRTAAVLRKTFKLIKVVNMQPTAGRIPIHVPMLISAEEHRQARRRHIGHSQVVSQCPGIDNQLVKLRPGLPTA